MKSRGKGKTVEIHKPFIFYLLCVGERGRKKGRFCAAGMEWPKP